MPRSGDDKDVRVITHDPYDGAYEGWSGNLGLRSWEQSTIQLDLRSLRFVTPTYLLRLRAFVEWHAQRGRQVEIRCPQQQSVANYIARMRVDRGLAPGAFVDLPTVRESDQSNVLIPVTKLLEERDVYEFSEQLRILLVDQPDRVATATHAIVAAISELCGNGVDHGKNDVGCLVAAQRYGESKIDLAIGDLGVGIPAHMRRRHKSLSTDSEAIVHALRDGVSGTGRSDRGNGYYWVMDGARQARLDAARLEVRSGSGRAVQSMGPTGRITTTSAGDGPNKRGTWLRYILRPQI